MKILCVLLAFTLFTAPYFAFTSSDLKITSTQVPLSTQLKKYYTGNEYVIENKSISTVNIVNAQIVNRHDGNIAFTKTMNNEPSAIARTWIIAGPVGLFTLGIGWAVGLLATPVIAIVSTKNKKKTQIESIPYSNMIALGELSLGDSTTVSTLVPIGSKPQLKLTIQDVKTKQLHSVNY